MKQLLCFSLVFLFSISVTTFPQNPEWMNYTNGDRISAIVMEDDFLWVGTWGGGLVKIDRYSGKTTFYDKLNSGLPSNYVSCITIDENGDKWIGTLDWFNDEAEGNPEVGGLVKFDGINWTVYHTSNSEIPSNDINCITIDNSGNKWIGAAPEYDSEYNLIGGGIAKFDDVEWTVYNTSNTELLSNDVTSIKQDDYGKLWIGFRSVDGLISFDGTNWTTLTFLNSSVNDIEFEDSDKVWIGTNAGVQHYNGAEWIIYNTSNSGLPDNSVECLEIGNSGNIWIGTRNGGIAIFDGFNWFAFNDQNSGLPSNYVSCIAIDENSNKWIGSYDGGLVKYDGNVWTKYNTSSSGLPASRLNCMAIDQDNNKWIGTSSSGLLKFDGKNWTTFNMSNSESISNIIGFIAIDKSNNKWMGTESWGVNPYGLAKFDGTDWTVYNTLNSALPGDHVNCIQFDKYDNMWIGTNNGLAKFDGTNWTVYNTSNSDLPDNTIFRFAIDNLGNLWILAFGDQEVELYKLDSNEATWTTFTSEDLGLDWARLDDIAVDASNNIWILGSKDYIIQLIKFDGVNWNVYYDEVESSQSFSPFSMKIDESNNIWIGTRYNGLKKFDGTSWTVYDESNSGLLGNWVDFIEIDDYGNKWIGGRGGLSVFNEGGIVSVEEKVTYKETVPTEYTLNQNYPNPFNPSTTLKYEIPSVASDFSLSKVTLKVYDILGREVATLVNKQQKAGYYEVNWDASNNSSGVYFYKINAGSFVETKKMILLR